MQDGHEQRFVDRRSVLKATGAGGLAGLTGLAGCAETGGGGSGVDGTVTYGVLSPMTGAYQGLGPNQRRGAQLGATHVNESDEFDVTIEVVTEDTGTDSETATNVAQRVVEREGANYLMGAISSSVAGALNSFASEQQVLYNPGAAAVAITGEQCSEYVFRVETNTAQIAEAVATYTVENLGTDVWFHIADYAYGESVLNRTERRMENESDEYTRVGLSRSELGASNFDSYVTEIQNSDAEVAILGMTGGDLINFVKQGAGKGLTDDVAVVSPTMTFQVVRGGLGADAYGTYGGVRYLPTLETGDNQSFVESFQNEHDQPPDNFARVGYDSIRMTAAGIREAGSTDPDDVIEALAGLDTTSVFGTNRFRECDHQAMNPTWHGELVEPDGGEGAAAVETVADFSGEQALSSLPCEETGCDL